MACIKKHDGYKDGCINKEAIRNMLHQCFQNWGHNESPYFVKGGQISLCLGLLPICVDFHLLDNKKIAKNLPHGIGHNFQACATLLKNPDKVGHFCAVSPMKFFEKLTGMVLTAQPWSLLMSLLNHLYCTVKCFMIYSLWETKWVSDHIALFFLLYGAMNILLLFSLFIINQKYTLNSYPVWHLVFFGWITLGLNVTVENLR